MEDQSMDKLSASYILLRAEREQLKLVYEADDAVLNQAMTEIENQMLDVMNSTNATSISTDNATVIRTVRKRYNPSNWEAVYKMIAKHEAFGLLEKRIHNGNMKDFLEQHPDEYPAGLNVDSRYAVTVRRKSST
jgi:hypothetical protein